MNDQEIPNQIPPQYQEFNKTSAYNEETDRLLRKYLKMSIAGFYWNIFSKIVIFILIIISFIYSTFTLGPFLMEILNNFNNLQGSVPQQNNANLDLNDIIKQLNQQNNQAN